MRAWKITAAAWLCAYTVFCSAAADLDSGQRIIVKWKAPAAQTRDHSLAEIRQRLRADGATLQHRRSMDGRRDVLNLDRRVSANELRAILLKLRTQQTVEYAVADRRRHLHTTLPNDTYFTATPGRSGQWYLQSIEAASLHAIDAWDETQGSNSIVVAVLDSGVRFDHPDLRRVAEGGKLLDGYDFVSCDQVNCDASTATFVAANDGNAWDADPSDPGDWVDSTDTQNPIFAECEIRNSSWHGTRVAGLIGAATNNGLGIAGAGWNTRVLPVRTIGKCGGYDSDILSAIRWAAGLPVTGAPSNPTPARVINLSLGAPGECTAAYQDAIDEVRALGVIVVASAGNESARTDSPANCAGVIGVAGLRHQGDKVGYSNLGPEIAIAAPAGNCVNVFSNEPCLYSIDTTFNTGTTTPGTNGYTHQYAPNYNTGTSFSAPLVSGVAALMLAVNPYLQPDVLMSRLQTSAMPFPTVNANACQVPANDNDLQDAPCDCTTATCGAGMLDALNAVQAAKKPIVNVSGASSLNAGQSTVLDGSASLAADGQALSFTWSVVTGGASLGQNNQSSVNVTAPASAGQVTIRLTVTDSVGTTNYKDLSITVNGPTNNPSSSGSSASGGAAGGDSGGGGGGGLGVWELLLILSLAAFSRMKSAVFYLSSRRF